MKENLELLKSKCGEKHYKALMALDNPLLHEFAAKYIKLCNPASVFVRTDSDEDTEYIRNKAAENREEIKLAVSGHTAHFDGYHDQARDKQNTKYLLPPDVNLGPNINSIDRDKGLEEVHSYLDNIMAGKEVYICFFCLGPIGSEFSIPAVQITDSAYVTHSESILYRRGYKEFKRIGDSPKFFRFVHSAGVLENSVSKNIGKRRVYIDLKENIVYSTNTQYAGNTVGLKKLSLRLALQRASKEGWLAEHMFVMGVHGPKNRVTYFTGAFPSACGKTSTAMLNSETIVGDDIAYLKKIGGKARAVNVERGIFGIIKDVGPKDDPLIWEALTSPKEVIFSNVLIKDGTPYWQGDGRPIPDEGVNYSGKWKKGKKDKDGRDILHAHSNARYTVRLRDLKNCDKNLENPDGVEIRGVIYGGRDSSTSVPVKQAFDWNHGILTMGASLESETTSATLGKVGVRKFNPMSNLDFLSVTVGRYIKDNLKFTEGIDNPPVIFSVNYFLKDKEGVYMTGMHDKHVWVKWMELRVNGDVDAIRTPVGYIPKYEDLKRLFKEVLDKEYKEKDYVEQFTLRVPENVERVDRIINIYKKDVADAPRILFDALESQKKRLLEVKAKYGDYIPPSSLISLTS
jgi:phosphoenolpyruvate carboxykinase (GTP)